MVVLGALVGTAALALGLGGWHLLHRRAVVPRHQGLPAEEGILGRLAALDARYLGREAEVDPTEWSGYQTDRTRLKEELQAVLAMRGRV